MEWLKEEPGGGRETVNICHDPEGRGCLQEVGNSQKREEISKKSFPRRNIF